VGMWDFTGIRVVKVKALFIMSLMGKKAGTRGGTLRFHLNSIKKMGNLPSSEGRW